MGCVLTGTKRWGRKVAMTHEVNNGEEGSVALSLRHRCSWRSVVCRRSCRRVRIRSSLFDLVRVLKHVFVRTRPTAQLRTPKRYVRLQVVLVFEPDADLCVLVRPQAQARCRLHPPHTTSDILSSSGCPADLSSSTRSLQHGHLVTPCAQLSRSLMRA